MIFKRDDSMKPQMGLRQMFFEADAQLEQICFYTKVLC